MRTIPLLAAGAVLAFTAAANAQAPAAQQPAAPPPAAGQAASPQITRVDVIDIEELPEATQTQVNNVVAQSDEADLQNLRSTLDATPQIKSALEAKGAAAAHVIAASMGADGTLTLVTKKPG